MNQLASKLIAFKIENRPTEHHPDLNAHEDYWEKLIKEVHELEEIAIDLANKLAELPPK